MWEGSQQAEVHLAIETQPQWPRLQTQTPESEQNELTTTTPWNKHQHKRLKANSFRGGDPQCKCRFLLARLTPRARVRLRECPHFIDLLPRSALEARNARISPFSSNETRFRGDRAESIDPLPPDAEAPRSRPPIRKGRETKGDSLDSEAGNRRIRVWDGGGGDPGTLPSGSIKRNGVMGRAGKLIPKEKIRSFVGRWMDRWMDGSIEGLQSLSGENGKRIFGKRGGGPVPCSGFFHRSSSTSIMEVGGGGEDEGRGFTEKPTAKRKENYVSV